jgi:nicotinic acid mononucleotide adenylyltransferase
VLSPGPSYTILTVGKCLAQGRGPVTLVMGNEVFRTLDAWKQPERLLELADIIVVTRDTLGEGDIPMVLGTLGIGGRWESPERFVHGERGRAVTVFPITPLPYAATPIRAAWAHYWQGAATGPTPQGVSPRVQDFIKKNRLYAVT